MEEQDKNKLIADLRASEEWYRSITESSVDAIVTANERDLFLTWNRGAENIFGYGPEIMGAPVITVIPERYRKAHLDGVKRFLNTGERHIIGKTVELEAIRKDGTEFQIELSLSSWESPSGIYFGAIIRDISERKQIERIREDVQRMMRHDLRSPLIGIAGLAKMLQKDANLTDKQRNVIALIQELSGNTIKFIDRARDLFQMEQGVYKLTPRPVNLIHLLNRINKELEPLTLKKDTNIKITVFDQPSEKKAEYILHGDEALLEVMFTNLIKNAAEGSPERSDVNVSIDIQEREGRKFHIIDIHNWGTVSKDIREKFFEPYITSGKKGGTGLGTYSSLLIARTHQGNIHYTTSEEEGTHVTTLLPIGIVSEKADSPNAREKQR